MGSLSLLQGIFPNQGLNPGLPHCGQILYKLSYRDAQNSPSQASTVRELWTSRCSSWIYKRQRNQRSNCQHPLNHRKKDNSRKTSASLTMLKPLTMWITTNCGKFFKRWAYQTTLPASWESCIQVMKQQLEPDMEKQTGSKLGKEHVKAVYCHLLT